MGAYAPVSAMDAETEQTVVETIFRPTLAALRAQGAPFSGLLYAGLMLTRDGPKVVEFNCRFGDPETEAIVPLLPSDPPLLDLLIAAARHESALASGIVRPDAACAVTTILASAGYPEAAQTGDVIRIPPAPDGVIVFHAGTKRGANGDLLTSGGRVLAITGLASSVHEAQRRSREFAARVDFAGKQFRRDIGWRELARQTAAGHAGAS
jgi:phosphoribosylamine--glycine ligase